MKRAPISLRRMAWLAVALALAGCAVGPAYERPAVDLPAAYTEPADTTAAGAPLPADWWKLYGDPQLDELVAATLANNSDLKLAAAQVEEAEGVARETGAAFFPEFDLNAVSNRNGVSTGTAVPSPASVPSVRNDHRFTLGTSFELDFWGKLRNASEAARARLLSTRYGRDVVLLTLSSTTAQQYFALRSLDAQIAVTRASIKSREDSTGIVRERVRAGYASDLDLAQTNISLATARTLARELQRQRALVEHQLGVLTGRLDIKLVPLDTLELPTPAVPPPGLPSSLVARRPDIRAAEQNLMSANSLIGVARAAQLPTFSLTGFLGGQSESLSDILLNPTRIWSVGVGLLFPVFDAGKYAARTAQAEARQHQALASWQKAIETAFRDVGDALSNVRQTVATEEDLRAAAAAARDAVRISRARYGAGYSAYLDVLEAERSLNDAELALVRNRQAQLSFTVDLIKAVGGGWTPAS